MPIRSTRNRSRGARGHRIGIVGIAVLATSSLGLASASAAAVVSVPLDPDQVGVSLYPVENTGPLSAQQLSAGGLFGGGASPAFTPVSTEWGGAVVIQLPTWIDASAMTVTLDLSSTQDGNPTRTYSTTAAPPDQLTVTDLGGESFRVDLPADDAVNGPYGMLNFDALDSADPRFMTGGGVDYALQFTGSGSSVATLAPQIMALAPLGCTSLGGGCPPVEVDAGGKLLLSVPAGSVLRALGLGTLDDMVLALEPEDANGDPTGDPVMLTDNPALVTVTDSFHATVTIPASTKGGSYALTLIQSTGTAGALSINFGELQVKGRPAAPRIVNAGLISNTGWVEPAPAAGPVAASSTPMIAAGAGMLGLAGVGIAVAVRGRRREALCQD
jgi:hypothetical protein